MGMVWVVIAFVSFELVVSWTSAFLCGASYGPRQVHDDACPWDIQHLRCLTCAL